MRCMLVDSLNNILLIGMTNRKDLIDPAIIRPGRFEIHIEIGLPSEEGRVQIYNIHRCVWVGVTLISVSLNEQSV